MGDYLGRCIRFMKGDAGSLDYGSLVSHKASSLLRRHRGQVQVARQKFSSS